VKSTYVSTHLYLTRNLTLDLATTTTAAGMALIVCILAALLASLEMYASYRLLPYNIKKTMPLPCLKNGDKTIALEKSPDPYTSLEFDAIDIELEENRKAIVPLYNSMACVVVKLFSRLFGNGAPFIRDAAQKSLQHLDFITKARGNEFIVLTTLLTEDSSLFRLGILSEINQRLGNHTTTDSTTIAMTNDENKTLVDEFKIVIEQASKEMIVAHIIGCDVLSYIYGAYLRRKMDEISNVSFPPLLQNFEASWVTKWSIFLEEEALGHSLFQSIQNKATHIPISTSEVARYLNQIYIGVGELSVAVDLRMSLTDLRSRLRDSTMVLHTIEVLYSTPIITVNRNTRT
jgi:hypothetical protein